MPQDKKNPQIVCFGELVWETFGNEVQTPGGTPLNIVYHLHKLKKTATIISRIGNDNQGKVLVHALKSKKVSMDFCQVDGHYITGEEDIISVDHNDVFHKIIYPAAWDHIEWKDYFPELVSNSEYFVFDSVSARDLASRKTLYKLLEYSRTNVFIVNMRPPHYNKIVIEYLLNKSSIVRMTVKELEVITLWEESFFDELSAMLFVKKKYNIQTLILIKNEGCVLLNMGNKFFHHDGYGSENSIISLSVGADAFMAAFLSKMIDGSLPDEILNFTCALSSVALKYPQWQSDYKLRDIFQVMRSAV